MVPDVVRSEVVPLDVDRVKLQLVVVARLETNWPLNHREVGCAKNRVVNPRSVSNTAAVLSTSVGPKLVLIWKTIVTILVVCPGIPVEQLFVHLGCDVVRVIIAQCARHDSEQDCRVNNREVVGPLLRGVRFVHLVRCEEGEHRVLVSIRKQAQSFNILFVVISIALLRHQTYSVRKVVVGFLVWIKRTVRDHAMLE